MKEIINVTVSQSRVDNDALSNANIQTAPDVQQKSIEAVREPAAVNRSATFDTSPAVSTSVPESMPPAVKDSSLGEDPKVYAYIRVSSRDQNEARQVDAMLEFGIAPSNMFMDKQSGKDFQRPAYLKLLAILQPGDTLVVKSIDRLGRNYDEILEQWRVITKEKQASIVVLDMPLLDTRNSRDLTGTLIADIVLQLLSYVAETERAFIKQRQKEGIAAAKARGQRFGRPRMDRGEEFPELVRQWKDGEISAAEAGRRLGVSHVTFLKWARE